MPASIPLNRAACCAALAFAVACAPDDLVDRSYIAPLHGQSGVSPDLELRVVSNIAIPPDYPVADQLIRVVDLESRDAGFVPGAIEFDDVGIRFVPDNPWREGHRYAWAVDDLEDVPHGPEFSIPGALADEAVFDTSPTAIAPLGAVIDVDDRACVVLSRPLGPSDSPEVRVTANGVELTDVGFTLLPQTEWGKPYTLASDDAGIDVICLETATPLQDGTALRISWGEDNYRFDLARGTVEDLILELRHGSWE